MMLTPLPFPAGLAVHTVQSINYKMAGNGMDDVGWSTVMTAAENVHMYLWYRSEMPEG